MGNENPLQAAAGLHDRDESIYEALLTAIVEQQLLPGSKLPEECAGGGVWRQPHRSTQSAATTRRCANGDINAQTWCTGRQSDG